MDEGDAPVTIDADENGVVGAVTAQMSERTSFIVLDQIASATAMLFPAQRIAAESHRRGIRILVDGAHAPAQLADPVGGELYLRLTAHAYVTADAIDRFAEQSIPTIVGWLRG